MGWQRADRLDGRQLRSQLNAVTTEDLVKLITIEGQERLLYKPYQIDIAVDW